MTNIDQMIEVLTAAKNGEKIECKTKHDTVWMPWVNWIFNAHSYDYRIAPKKEMTLVEELRQWDDPHGVKRRAADRIEELECYRFARITQYTDDELLDELKRRIK